MSQVFQKTGINLFRDVSMRTDTSGNNRFSEVFANTTDELIDKLMADIFGNLQYNLYLNLTSNLYGELADDDTDDSEEDGTFGIGGTIYRAYIADVETKFLASGKYREAISDALYDSAAYGGRSDDINGFRMFVDTVYQDYSMQSLLEGTLDDIFNIVESEVFYNGIYAWDTSHIPDVTTAYMRYLFRRCKVNTYHAVGVCRQQDRSKM